MMMVQSCSFSLLSSQNHLFSPPKSSQFRQNLKPFHNHLHALNPFSSHPILWHLTNLHGVRVPSLQTHALSSASAVEAITETSDGDLDFVEIGYVSDVHGLAGDIRVKHNTDFPDLRFGQPGTRWLRQQYSGKEEVLEVDLVAGRGHQGSKSWIVKLRGFDSIDEARQLVGSTFLVRNDDRPELEEGEYYSRDLVGMRVTLKETGEVVGTVANIFNNGGNDLLQVLLEASTGSSDGSLEQKSLNSEAGHLVWIPFVEAIVPDVDMDKREMQITPPKGLFELNVRSNEKSKKERRRIEWRERKKNQRRLISAKKKLCELEQQHIFHGFRYGEKSQRSLLAEQILDVNSNLLHQALQVIQKPINGCDTGEAMFKCNTWKCCGSLKISEKHLSSTNKEEIAVYSEHAKLGERLISEGKLATVIVLNSKIPEKHAESGIVDFGNGEIPTIDHLETLLSEKQTFMQAEHRESVSIILISPVEEIQILEELFSSNDYFGLNPNKVKFVKEEKLPVVSSSEDEQKKNKVLMKSPWEIHQSPIGFGGAICALSSNNILDDLVKAGVEYIEVCSINQESICGNPLFFGFVNSQEPDVGLLTFENKTELDENFHIILPVKSMKKMVNQMEKFPLCPVLKSNSHVELINKEWVDVIPSKPNSYEFSCSLQSLLKVCSFEKACIMEVTK